MNYYMYENEKGSIDGTILHPLYIADCSVIMQSPSSKTLDHISTAPSDDMPLHIL